jgi:hypothetical protein
VAAVEDEEFLLAFKFHRGKPATLRLSAQATGDRGGDIVVATALRSTVQPRPELPSQEKLHFRGRVRLARQLPAAPRAEFPPDARGEQIERDAIYRVFFHGPAYRVLDSVTVDQERAVGVMAGRLPDDVVPPGCLLTTPRLLELCFQTAGTWLLARRHLMALPAAIGRVRFFAAPDSGTQLYAVVEARAGGGAFDGRVLDAAGQVYLELSDYRVVPLPEPRTLVA